MIAWILSISLFLTTPDNKTEVRSSFYKASKNSKANIEFKKLLDKMSLDDPIILGYKGMSEMLTAYHSINPIIKYTAFLKGKELLENSIKKAPEDIELRFLRYSVQRNAPSFLFYNANIHEDEKYLRNALSNGNIDKDLFKRINDFFNNLH